MALNHLTSAIQGEGKSSKSGAISAVVGGGGVSQGAMITDQDGEEQPPPRNIEGETAAEAEARARRDAFRPKNRNKKKKASDKLKKAKSALVLGSRFKSFADEASVRRQSSEVEESSDYELLQPTRAKIDEIAIGDVEIKLPAPLPANWVVLEAKIYGVPYFHNTLSGESSWVRPDFR